MNITIFDYKKLFFLLLILSVSGLNTHKTPDNNNNIKDIAGFSCIKNLDPSIHPSTPGTRDERRVDSSELCDNSQDLVDNADGESDFDDIDIDEEELIQFLKESGLSQFLSTGTLGGPDGKISDEQIKELLEMLQNLPQI